MNPGELHNPSSEEETLMTCNTMTSWVIKKEKDHQKRRTRNTKKKIWEKEEDPALAFFCASYFDSFWEDEHEEKMLLIKMKMQFLLTLLICYILSTIEVKKNPDYPAISTIKTEEILLLFRSWFYPSKKKAGGNNVMVVQMCDFMNSQETRIAYLKWRSQKGITCTWYMLRYCLLLRHEKQRVARRSVRCVRKEKKVVTRWHLLGRSEMYGEGLTDGYRWGEDPWVALSTYVCPHNFLSCAYFSVPRLFGIRYTHQ